jgi:hypothetical protein
MTELPGDDGPDISAAAYQAPRGHKGMTSDQARELLEDLADGRAARQALEEPGEDIPAEEVWAALGLT